MKTILEPMECKWWLSGFASSIADAPGKTCLPPGSLFYCLNAGIVRILNLGRHCALLPSVYGLPLEYSAVCSFSVWARPSVLTEKINMCHKLPSQCVFVHLLNKVDEFGASRWGFWTTGCGALRSGHPCIVLAGSLHPEYIIMLGSRANFWITFVHCSDRCHTAHLHITHIWQHLGENSWWTGRIRQVKVEVRTWAKHSELMRPWREKCTSFEIKKALSVRCGDISWFSFCPSFSLMISLSTQNEQRIMGLPEHIVIQSIEFIRIEHMNVTPLVYAYIGQNIPPGFCCTWSLHFDIHDWDESFTSIREDCILDSRGTDQTY